MSGSNRPDKVKTVDKGSYTETWEYTNGTATRVFQTEKETGETTDYNIGRGGLLGAFGPYKAGKK